MEMQRQFLFDFYVFLLVGVGVDATFSPFSLVRFYERAFDIRP